MSEEKLRDLENSPVEEAQPFEDNENAPRSQEKPAEAEASRPRRRKKRRGARIRMQAAALLLVIALAFGILVGYAVGRSAVLARLKAAEDRIEELTHAMEESGRQVMDVFTENLSAQNREALADLSGLGMVTPEEENVFMSDDFSGAEGAAEANPVVVAEYNGGSIMSDELRARYNERLAGYLFSGYSEEELAGSLMQSVLEELVAERVIEQQAAALGVEPGQAEADEIAAAARLAYDQRIADCLSFVSTEDMSEDEAIAAAQDFLMETEGVSLESIRAGMEEEWRARKLREAVAGDVQPGESEILALYNALLTEQREVFEDDPAAFARSFRRGETIAYRPEGWREIEIFSFRFADMNSVSEAQRLLGALELAEDDAGRTAELTAEMDALYASLEQAARQMIDSGSLDAHASTRSYVHARSSDLSGELVSAAMALENVGDLSPVLRLEDGVCILRYASELPAGAVPMAEIEPALTELARAKLQEAAYEARCAEWLEEADAKYYPERMQ